MNLLITGRGTSGSWRIRGEQLGRAIGATVIPKALDVAGFDAAVVVKRADHDLLARLHRAEVPIIWDVVDAWPQPTGNRWTKPECMAWLAQEVKRFKPAGIVAATRAMAADCAAFGVPVLALPHHGRPGIARNPVRETVQRIGYEGGVQYLGQWEQVLRAECKRRGWVFVINPPQLADLDIVVALRNVDGYGPRHWKSNVKLANAQASGTPFIGCTEAGYTETRIGTAERFADTPEQLIKALDALTPHKARQRASEWMLTVAPNLETIARTYRAWLSEVTCSTTAQSS